MTAVNLILFIAFVALQLADAVTTYTILSLGGRERFYAMRWMIQKLGLNPALAVKTVLTVAIMALICSVPSPWIPAILVVFYGLVVGNNIRVLRRIR